MSTHRSSGYPRSYHHDPHRASTGNFYVTSYDMPSSGHSSRSNISSGASQASNITYEAQPIRKTINSDGKKTEYIVRPRNNSTSAHDVKKPLPLNISAARNLSPPRRGPRHSASPREITSAGLSREDPSRLLSPSTALVPRKHTSHHQRHNSASLADAGAYNPYSPKKSQLYHVRGQEPAKQYYVSRSQPHRQAEEEDWSYTGPREQFARDYPQRPRRDSHSRRERQVNAYESDAELSPRRNYGPPPSSSRQLVRADRVVPEKYSTRSGFDSDPDRPNEASRRHQSLRTPAVLHQQHLRDEGYSSSRDDYESKPHHHKYIEDDRRRQSSRRDSLRTDDREYRTEREHNDEYERRREYDSHGSRDHRRKKDESRDTSPQKSHYKELATGALGGLATAGTIGTLLGRDSKDKHIKSDDEESKPNHHRRRRHHKRDEDAPDSSDEHRRSRKHDESSSESREEKPRRRRHSKRRPSEAHEEIEAETARTSDSQRSRRPRSVSRVRPEERDYERDGRELVSTRDRYKDDDPYEPRTISPGEGSDDRPRKVMLVEPEKKEEVKPKGILKPARQVPFPEDPNPIREGVAPLKDAKKDGVPANARWTKISRVLVNPEALEKANERFEERDDYVIVLRVVTREEIQKLAEKTIQIRAAREKERDRYIETSNRDRANGHGSDFSNNDDDDDEEDHRHPLAIEPPPAAAPANDLRNLTQPPYQAHHVQPPYQAHHDQPPPQSIPIRASNNEPQAMPEINDDDVHQYYSQNV